MAGKNRVSYDMIVSAKQGNMASIGYILEAYSPQVEAVLYSMAPLLSEECLKNCRQEVLIRLVRVIPKFKLKY